MLARLLAALLFSCFVAGVVLYLVMTVAPWLGLPLGPVEALLCAGAAFFGSLLFQWMGLIEEKSDESRQRAEAAEKIEGFPEHTNAGERTLFAVVMILFACATCWIPVLGFLVTSYTAYRVGQANIPDWLSLLVACIFILSVAATIVGAVFLLDG